MSKPTRTNHNRARTDSALRALINYCNETRGSKTRLQAAMEAKLGHPVMFKTVVAWTHTDERKRQMPDMETGLAMLEVWKSWQRTVKK